MTIANRGLQLCVPLTDIFRRNQTVVLPLTAAVSFKEVTDEIFDGKEHMLECSLNLGHAHFQEEMVSLGFLSALRSGLFTSFACDLGPAWTAYSVGVSPNGYPRYFPKGERVDEQKYVNQAHQNVSFLKKNFSGRIKVENLNYFPTGAYDLVCDPVFISRFVHQSDVELLLDLGHLVISCTNLQIRLSDYVGSLPLDLVSEVHISGSGSCNGILEDTHEPPADADIAILRSILTRADIQYLTLEYYKDDKRLIETYQMLYDDLVA